MCDVKDDFLKECSAPQASRGERDGDCRRFGVVTTSPTQARLHSGLVRHGWRWVGSLENPGTGHLLRMWWKSFPSVKPGSACRWDGNLGEAFCCGLVFITNSLTAEEMYGYDDCDDKEYLNISIYDHPPRREPKGWQLLGRIEGKRYYTNVPKRRLRRCATPASKRRRR